MRVGILGASGYAGGEFLRLALGHPGLEVGQVTSREYAGQPVHIVHPNLRGVTGLRFCRPEELEPVDVLVSALPHGGPAERVGDYLPPARRALIHLSADFRLPSAGAYGAFHSRPHPRPDLLGTFIYGNPELHRAELVDAASVPAAVGAAARADGLSDLIEGAVPGGPVRIAGAGCIATATILALHPLVVAGVLNVERDVIADAKIGSSAAGKDVSLASHHPERSGAVRTYAPTGHRHQAEIAQELAGGPTVHLSATAVERVRGVLVAAHAFVREGVVEPEVLEAFRRAYDAEPFVRLVRARRGVHRVPDPRILDGTNYCDVGFAFDELTGRVVALAALDNLVKGTAGHAVQALNLALGFPEATGLGFTGLHP